jgi:hypothetical protein
MGVLTAASSLLLPKNGLSGFQSPHGDNIVSVLRLNTLYVDCGAVMGSISTQEGNYGLNVTSMAQCCCRCRGGATGTHSTAHKQVYIDRSHASATLLAVACGDLAE